MHEGNPGKPLYARVREDVTRRIASGDWAPGAKLPGELALCRLYSVSRITVRQALKELEDEGLIERRQGRGTTVKARQFEQRLTSMYSFSEELMKAGAEPSSHMLQFMVCEAADEVAARLSIARGAPVFSVKRLRLAGREPFALETSWIPQALAQGLTARDVEEKGLYNAMRECAGVFPRQAEETFRAAALPQECAQHLGEKKNAPAMVVERVAYWKNTPVEYCLSWIRADKFRFTVSLNPPGRVSAAQPWPHARGKG